jgi:hypothetical protein
MPWVFDWPKIVHLPTQNAACVGNVPCYNCTLMHAVMEALVELQKLEFDTTPKSGAAKATIDKLRAQVPPQILGHYDRLMARGKKGISLVKRNICGECHMSVPIGTVVTILKGADIQLCGNCGRYLYAYPEAAEEAAPAPAPVEAPKPKRQPRAKKKSAEQPPPA